MVDAVKVFTGYFFLGAQTSEVLLALKNLAHILSQECFKNKFCAFLPKDNFPFKCIPISKKTSFVKGAPKLNFTLYSRVVIYYFNTGLSKSVFSAYYFGKLLFRLSVFYVFSVF